MELTLVISIIGVVLSIATFVLGRITASRSSGREEGQILTELGYIKSGVDDTKRKLESMENSYHKLEARVGRLEEKVNIYHQMDGGGD